MNIDNNLRHLLENETKIHLAEIRFLYQKLDRQLGLNGARVPITFGFDTDRLGAYSPKAAPEGEGFHFSLLFIGYCVAKPLSKDDRMDLYKHEYAHYMQYNMDIPDKYNWQPGIHGSAWKYCCSLIGAALTTKPVKDLLSTIMIRFSKRKLLTRVFLSATHIHANRNTAKRKTVL